MSSLVQCWDEPRALGMLGKCSAAEVRHGSHRGFSWEHTELNKNSMSYQGTTEAVLKEMFIYLFILLAIPLVSTEP